MRSSFIITLLFSAVLLLSLSPAEAQQSFTCQFNSGARAGSTVDYAGVPGALPGEVGGPCDDGQGSSGLLLAPATTAAPPLNAAVVETGWSATCRFTDGPKAGQIINADGAPDVRWGPIGRACGDGQGSTGVVVSASTPGAVRWSGGTQPPSLGFTCQFTGGPRAGQSASFNGVPGAQPGPVGAPCGDSAGSTGVIRP